MKSGNYSAQDEREERRSGGEERKRNRGGEEERKGRGTEEEEEEVEGHSEHKAYFSSDLPDHQRIDLHVQQSSCKTSTRLRACMP
eukprot:760850-Hanusia_phi.AAC.3